MQLIGVGVVGASPSRPGWAVAAHLPAIDALSEYRLRAVATSNLDSARAAQQRFGVPGFADARELIARRDVDLVVIAVKVPCHDQLVAAGLDAGKMVMCEWPLGIDMDQTNRLALQAKRSCSATLIGLQASMAPSIRYARALVKQGYVGEVLGTAIVGSGLGWGPVTDEAHRFVYDAANNVTTLSVPTMHAIDALSYVLGDFTEVRAESAIRRKVVQVADTGEEITVSAPDHIALTGRFASGAIASVFYRGGVSRGDNFRWEINGSEGDLILTSPVGNMQLVPPLLFGGCGEAVEVEAMSVPSEYELVPAAPEGPAGNVARLYAAFSKGLREGRPSDCAPDFAHAVKLHRWQQAIETAALSGAGQPL